MVRDRLDQMKLEYEKIEVPFNRGSRKEVFEVSGQYLVPVLVDGEMILDDEEKILAYLEEKYGKRS